MSELNRTSLKQWAQEVRNRLREFETEEAKLAAQERMLLTKMGVLALIVKDNEGTPRQANLYH